MRTAPARAELLRTEAKNEHTLSKVPSGPPQREATHQCDPRRQSDGSTRDDSRALFSSRRVCSMEAAGTKPRSGSLPPRGSGRALTCGAGRSRPRKWGTDKKQEGCHVARWCGRDPYGLAASLAREPGKRGTS